MVLEEGTNCKADDWNIDELSQPWVSDLEDGDLASVAFASERSFDGCNSTDSSRSPKSLGPETVVSFVAVSPYLESLMNRYPNHIPARLPRMRKRRRPLCLFVNFMGTRKKKTTPSAKPPGTNTGIGTGSSHRPHDETSMVPATSTKRQKVVKHQNEGIDTTGSIIVT